MQYKCKKNIISLILCMLSLTTIQRDGFCLEAATNDIAKGGKIWANNCARCHNPRPATEFSKESWQTIMQHMRILGGLTGQESRDVLAFLVPEFAPTEQVNATPEVKEATTTTPTTNKTTLASSNTAATVKTSAIPKDTKSTSKLTGQAIFQQTCVACHGANGKGAVPGAPDFTKSGGPLSQSNTLLIKHIKEGFQKAGDPMAMPPKGGNANLTDDDIKNVLDYIEKTFKH
jgi:mono/diheme cytochrome c family protein